MDPTGDTASLKRKREQKDEALQAQKKHRRKSKLQENGISQESTGTPRKAAPRQTDGEMELPGASSQPTTALSRERLAAWKVSKPMGGRMLDIDPVFSADER